MLTLFKAFKDEVLFKVLGFTGTCLLTVVVFDTVLVVVGVGLLETGVFFTGVLSNVLFLVVTGFVYVFYCDYNSGFSLLSGLL